MTSEFSPYLRIFGNFCAMYIFSLSMFHFLLDSSVLLEARYSLAQFRGLLSDSEVSRMRFSIYEDDDRDGESTWSQGLPRVYGALMALAIAIFIARVTAQY